MNIIYKKYEAGFEKYQAFIYNNAIKKYNGESVTAKEIKERLKSHSPKQDLEGINFAFTDEGTPLSYIQYRIFPGDRIFIGFPWATPECPLKVQENLFSNLLNYIKNKYSNHDCVYLGHVSDDYSDVHTQIKEFGFEKDEWFCYYTWDPKKSRNISFEGFSYREAEKSDLELILTILKEDPSIDFTNTQGRWNKYFSARFEDTTILLLFKSDILISSIGFTTDDLNRENIQTRFIVFNPKYENNFEQLLGAIARYSFEKNIKGIYQIILGNGEESRLPILEKHGARKSASSSRYFKKL